MQNYFSINSTQTNLIIANTRFQKRRGKRFTFMSKMNICKSLIYYILIKNNEKTV